MIGAGGIGGLSATVFQIYFQWQQIFDVAVGEPVTARRKTKSDEFCSISVCLSLYLSITVSYIDSSDF